MNLLLALVILVGPVDPYKAFSDGDYTAALKAFQERQTLSPDDLELLEQIANTHYRLGNFEAAKRAYSQLAERVPENNRPRALYNLANTEFRRGQLLKAIELYNKALEQNANDADAQHNLDLAKRILERQQQQSDPPRSSENQPEDDRSDDTSTSESQTQNGKPNSQALDNEESGEQAEQKPGENAQPRPRKGDRDGDGIPNTIERKSKHGSDPRKSDTDGDGLLDGHEDVNRNGRVDPGETDPTNPDSDGDGVGDALDESPTTPNEATGEQLRPNRPTQTGEGLTEQQAERYLQILQEQPPLPQQREQHHPAQEKDW